MLPLSERMHTVFSALKTSPHRFANQHELNRSSVFNVLNGERRPSFDLVERICIAEPRISAEYLLRGEGEPLRDASQAMALTTVEELRGFKIEINQSLDRRIKELGGGE